MGTCRQGWVANHLQYISPEMSSCDRACTGNRNLATHSQVISTTGLCNDYWSSNHRNSTWFTRLFSSWEVWSGYKTKAAHLPYFHLMHIPTCSECTNQLIVTQPTQGIITFGHHPPCVYPLSTRHQHTWPLTRIPDLPSLYLQEFKDWRQGWPGNEASTRIWN